MAKIRFRDWEPKTELTAKQRQAGETLSPADKVARANLIIGQYQRKGYKLTLRQLYYQFVARALIPNTEKSYDNFGALLTKARYAGLVDWAAIEDRGREPTHPLQFSSLQERVEYAVSNYRLPRWDDQPQYAELWVEKQALAGVLEPIARDLHVTLSVNKGYSSASAMFEAAMRFRAGGRTDRKENARKPKVLYYLGDHDPSGEDMVRDVEARLVEFGVSRLRVVKLALTMEQVEEYKPPPNPAKTTDSRYEAYAEKHGTESWEVDALDTEVLDRVIRDAFAEIMDVEAMDRVKAREQRGRDALTAAAENINDDEGDDE